jgi:hypothetical protein
MKDGVMNAQNILVFPLLVFMSPINNASIKALLSCARIGAQTGALTGVRRGKG